MNDVDERVATLEAIAYGSDPRISPSDRMKALEMLSALPGGGAQGSAAMLEVAGEVAQLSGDALDAELAGMFATGWQDPPPSPPPPPGSEKDIEQRVEARTKKRMRRWLAEQAGRREPSKPEPDRVVAEVPPKPSTEPRRPPEDELAKRRKGNVVTLDTGERIDFDNLPAWPNMRTPGDMNARYQIAMGKVAQSEVREQARAEKREAMAAMAAPPCPPGVDPQAWALYATEMDGV